MSALFLGLFGGIFLFLGTVVSIPQPISSGTLPPPSLPPMATTTKRYVAEPASACGTVRFACQTNEEYFIDDKGCGCQVRQSAEEIYCPAIYQPVCAEVEIQCIRAPCINPHQTYGNACEARRAGVNIKNIVPGECPPASPATNSTSKK